MILLATVFSTVALSFANGTFQALTNDPSSGIVKKQKGQKVIEHKLVSEKGLMTCYKRECSVGSRDNGDGTVTEVKVCSDWVEIPCSRPSEPQPPTMSIQ